MAAPTNIAQTRRISTPAVYVSDILYAIVPNSCSYTPGGEVTVRAASSGGGSISIVAGVNAEKMLSTVKFELDSTAANIDAVRNWRANANVGTAETIQLADPAGQYAFDLMFLANDPEIALTADGKMRCEFMGRHVQ